jgi:hypothetical protein
MTLASLLSCHIMMIPADGVSEGLNVGFQVAKVQEGRLG